MAKKKTETKTSIVEDVPDGTIPGVDNGKFEFDLVEDEIRTIKVHKIVPGHRPIFQFETINKVTESLLQKYGGGLYTISYYGEDERKPKHVDEIEVGEPPVDPSKPVDATTIQIQMLKEQSQMNRELLMAVLGRTNPTVGAPTPMSEIATMWGLIHGVNPANNNNSFDKLIEVFKLGMELGGKGNGEMDWKTALISTVKDLGPSIVQVAAASKGVEVKTNGATQVAAAATPDQILKQGLTWIKPRIFAGMPVSLALDWVVSNATDPTIQPFIAQALTKEFQDLVNADNDVASEPYNTWLRQFLSGIKEQFKAAAVDETEETDNPDDQQAS